MASMLEMDPESAIFKAIVEKLPSEGPETWDQEEPLGKIYCETKLRRYDMTKIKNMFAKSSFEQNTEEKMGMSSDYRPAAKKESLPLSSFFPMPSSSGLTPLEDAQHPLFEKLHAEGGVLASLKSH